MESTVAAEMEALKIECHIETENGGDEDEEHLEDGGPVQTHKSKNKKKQKKKAKSHSTSLGGFVPGPGLPSQTLVESLFPWKMVVRPSRGRCAIAVSNKQQRYTMTGESDVSSKILVLEKGHHPRFVVQKAGEGFDCEVLRRIAKLCFYVVYSLPGPCKLHSSCSSHSKKWVVQEYIKYLQILVRVLAPLHPQDWARAAQACTVLRCACISVLSTVTFLDLKNAGASLNDESFALLSTRLGTKLQRLELDCWHLSDKVLKNVPDCIEELALCGCDHHSNALLANLAERTHTALRRFAWSGFGGKVTAAGFQNIALKCRKLTSFMIDSGASMDVNSVVCAVASNCPALSELSAFDLTMDTFGHIRKCKVKLKRLRHKRRNGGALPVTDITLLMLIGMCPLLEELHLVDKSDVDGSGDVTDVGLLALTERASTLRTLKLKLASSSSAERCSEVAVMELASMCKLLTHVELSNFKRLSDPPVYELIQRCPKLVELMLDGTPITDASLDLLALHCKYLRSISIKGCKKLSEAGLKALGQCGTLESVNAGQTQGVTDAAVSALCEGNLLLKSLVLSHGNLSDVSLKSIAVCTHMEELALHGCSRISNGGLGLLAAGCVLLRYISLSYCDHISDSGVISLALACPRLLKVRLDGCRLISNPTVRALCQHCPKLRHLSLQYCVKLSDNVFQHLLSAPSLRFVDLGRAKLTTEAMTNYQKQKPFVELCLDGMLVTPNHDLWTSDVPLDE